MDDDLLADPGDPYPGGVEGPTVDIPSPDLTRESAADGETTRLLKLFVLHVLVWNAVLLAVALAGMLIYFRGDWAMGGRLLGVGFVLSVYGVYRWPRNSGGDD